MKTFVFTDIVKSVTLKGQMSGRSEAERDGAFVTTILTPHRQKIEHQLAESGGRVVSTAGDGHFLVFSNTIQAATWAIGAQQAHRDAPIRTPSGELVRVRMSLHVGFPQADPGDPSNFIGRVVDYAARLNDYATGAQVLVSSAALGLLKDAALDGVRFHPHGERDLRGIGGVEVYELLYDQHGPRPTRDDPKGEDRREWSVLPLTMGLTEYGMQGGSSGVATSISATRSVPSKRRLGNYELGELLGAGGMGDVYKARHVQFERVRAVKVIKPHFLESGNQGVIKRFYREIKAIGALDHPNIVVAVDSSAPSDDTHYLVMEYVDGVSTDELVKREGPLAVADACEVVRQAAIGLDYISTQGMVHRDIKPSNLMVTLVKPPATSSTASPADPKETTPVVKILDLGLALLVDHDQPRLTQMDHGAMGTAMYMSPEQWKTTSVDVRSDIYSLGCSLFHLLTGSPPFYDSDLKPERAHERLAPPSLRGQSGVPKGLDAVLKKMLAKNPGERYQSPAEVAAALESFAKGANLKPLVLRHQKPLPGATTRPDGHDETLAGSTRQRDTLPGQEGARSHRWQDTYHQPLPVWRRWALPIGLATLLLVVAAVAWSTSQLLRSNQQQNLANLAVLAAPQLSKEIEDRFGALANAASDPRLRDAMLALKEEPEDWSTLQQWIEQRWLRTNERLPSNSWFITDSHGQQVARAPSSSSIGETYWRRDYFHGQGRHLPDSETEQPNPIDGPHLCAVYRSDSTKQLKIAFSVPIKSNERRPQDRRVLGVLGMSIELGNFQLFEDSKLLTKPLELVLVDLRQGELEGGPQEGLILHHPDLHRFSRAFRLPQAPLDQAISLVEEDRLESGGLLQGYPELLKRTKKPYWGGYYPVDVPSQSQKNAKWLVIVQEPMP